MGNGMEIREYFNVELVQAAAAKVVDDAPKHPCLYLERRIIIIDVGGWCNLEFLAEGLRVDSGTSRYRCIYPGHDFLPGYLI